MAAIRSFHAFRLQVDEATDRVKFTPQPGKPAGVLLNVRRLTF